MSGSQADFWQGPSGTLPVVNANGNIFEEVQVATAGQTVFTLISFTYTVGQKSIWVFRRPVATDIGGEMLRRAVDYTETASNKITLASGATVGDTLIFIAFGVNQLIAPVVNNGLPQGGATGAILQKIDGSDYNATWTPQGSVTTLLDALRQNIASATTVNLVPLAATTRNILITGSIEIDGFAITNGQVWAVRFAASLLLKNNLAINTGTGADLKVSANSTCLIRAVADNTVEILSFVQGTQPIIRIVNDFRLTPATGVPIPASNIGSLTTIYCTPYTGNSISLYDGAAWQIVQSNEFSIALSGLTVSLVYDIFCFNNAGTPTLEIAGWASSTTRSIALVRQDGILVASTDAKRRYLGSFTARSANSFLWTDATKDIYNYYNKALTRLYVSGDAASWTYVPATVRQARGSSANQLNLCVGIADVVVEARLAFLHTNSAAAGSVTGGIGVNGTTGITDALVTMTSSTGSTRQLAISCTPQLPIGSNFLSWNEASDGVNTATFQGNNGSGTLQATAMM